MWFCTGAVEVAVHEGEAVEARERGQGVHGQRPAQLRVVLHVEVEQVVQRAEGARQRPGQAVVLGEGRQGGCRKGGRWWWGRVRGPKASTSAQSTGSQQGPRKGQKARYGSDQE